MLIGVMAFVTLLIAILAIPLNVKFQVSWPRTTDNDIRLQWAFGLVRLKIPSAQSNVSSLNGERTQRKVRRSARPFMHKQRVLTIVRQRRLRRRIFRFLSDVWRSMAKEDLRLHIRVGLGDPADTGRLWAVVGPVAAMVANVRDASISVDPDFFEAIFELDGDGYIRIIPLQFVYLTCGLLLSPTLWRGVKQMRAVAL